MSTNIAAETESYLAEFEAGVMAAVADLIAGCEKQCRRFVEWHNDSFDCAP